MDTPVSPTPLSIESIQTTLVDVPLRRPHKVSVATFDRQSVVLVRLATTDGIVGIGEAVVPFGPWWSGESIEGIQVLIDQYLAPILIGQDARRPELLVRELDQMVSGARFAKAAVEMALWDTCGKVLGVPVYQLFGGLVRDAIPVTWAVGAEPAQVIADQIEEKLESGRHSSFKLKMGGGDPAGDVGRITAVAKSHAHRVSLRVDLNGAWDELTATRWLPHLQDAGIELVEQPVPAWNTEALARLSARLTIPVMADECLQTPQDAVHLIGNHACDLLSVKIAKCGGLSAVSRIGTIAETGGIACHGGTTVETSIGTAASVHIFCATFAVSAGSELIGPLLLADDLVTEPVTYTSAGLLPPQGPGLGVTLDEDKIAAYARK